MNQKMVRSVVDLSKPPVITAEVRANMEEIRKIKDEDIDLSEMPELDDSFWKNAVRGSIFRARKQSTTVRIDADVLHWLKKDGKGYQSRLNAILRREMQHSLSGTKAVRAASGRAASPTHAVAAKKRRVSA